MNRADSTPLAAGGNGRLPVGASLLAKNVNDNAGYLILRGVLGFFASKLAPTRTDISRTIV
ncbi:hypothetical protein EUX57_05060 [Pseudomonas orientalis]|uniref:Uncharacterized protein n=1 Tax=Pseudomonas orientalis TaxID=76758 RepID=A0A4Q7D4L9_9PSED|nr:hypothetical protein EUX57_05060 [Pseudomonas orientalis]